MMVAVEPEDFKLLSRDELISELKRVKADLAQTKQQLSVLHNAKTIKQKLAVKQAHQNLATNLNNANENAQLINIVRQHIINIRCLNLRIENSCLSIDFLPPENAEERVLSEWLTKVVKELQLKTVTAKQFSDALFSSTQSEQRRYRGATNASGNPLDDEEKNSAPKQPKPPKSTEAKLLNELRLEDQCRLKAANAIENAVKQADISEHELEKATKHGKRANDLQAQLNKERAEVAATDNTHETKVASDNSDNDDISDNPDNGDINDNPDNNDISDNGDNDDFNDEWTGDDDAKFAKFFNSGSNSTQTSSQPQNKSHEPNGNEDSEKATVNEANNIRKKDEKAEPKLKRGKAALNEIAEGDMAVIPDPDSRICPKCGAIENQVLIPHERRITQGCFDLQAKADRIITITQTVECRSDSCGSYTYEINPASASSICAINRNEERVMELDDLKEQPHSGAHVKVAESAYPQTKEDLTRKDELCQRYAYSDKLKNVLINVGGKLIYDPVLYNLSCASELYGIRPLYVGGKYSLNAIAFELNLYITGWTSKCRAIDLSESFAGEQIMSVKQHVISINKTGRIFFHGTAQEILFNLLTRCKVLHMDETRLMVDTFPNSTNYLWVIASGPNEPYQGCVYIVSNDRSHRNILRLLSGDPEWCPDFAHGREFKLSVEIIVCDAFAGYDTAARLHNEEAGASQISLARCLQHANRLVIRSVDNMGLDKIYLKLTEEDFVKFSEKLEAYAKEYDLTQIDQNLLKVRYYIEALYRIEHFMSDQDLECNEENIIKEKRHIARKIMCEIFALSRESIKLAGNLITRTMKNGRAHYECRNPGTWLQALCYLLNSERDFMTFTKRTDVPLTNNLAERMIRKPVFQRSNMVTGFRSTDGALAFAEMRSVAATCDMNGVQLMEYLPWLMQSIKKDSEELRLDLREEHQNFFLIQDMKYPEDKDNPPTDEVKQERNRLGNAYNPKNFHPVDRLNYEHLEPAFYKTIKKLCTPNPKESEEPDKVETAPPGAQSKEQASSPQGMVHTVS